MATALTTEDGTVNSGAAAGRVGIGTTSPSELLTLGDGSSNRGYLTIKNSTSSSPTIRFNDARAGGSDWYIYNGSADAGSVSIYNGSHRLVIDEDGNVGIGTTSPSELLTLGDGSSNRGYLTIKNGTSNSPTIRFDDARAGGSDWYIYNGSADAGTISFYNGGHKMVIDDGGNVGIGVTDPDEKLEINGQIKITGGSPGAGKVLQSDANGVGSWVANTPSSGGGWTDDGSTVRLTTSTDQVSIGTTSPASNTHLTIEQGSTKDGIAVKDASSTTKINVDAIVAGSDFDIGAVGAGSDLTLAADNWIRLDCPNASKPVAGEFSQNNQLIIRYNHGTNTLYFDVKNNSGTVKEGSITLS